mmetsp:Transcript_32152/g.49165  ORF Transcript_32152/g.49165 Transcript_32152/m.49165 type:complete len:213 (+) Transcript_32152:469-1107(+)
MEARKLKGTLNLNNGRPNGDSWKQPPLDQALQNVAGQNGGETNIRFYMKFPIYRPRNQAPDVSDDVNQIWDDQINKSQFTKPNYLIDTRNLSYVKQTPSMQDERGTLNYETNHQRSTSMVTSPKGKDNKIFKLAGKTTLHFPRRDRFNEDSHEVIKDFQSRSGAKVLSERHLEPIRRGGEAEDGRSKVSTRYSQSKTLTKMELSKYFNEKQQ